MFVKDRGEGGVWVLTGVRRAACCFSCCRGRGYEEVRAVDRGMDGDRGRGRCFKVNIDETGRAR